MSRFLLLKITLLTSLIAVPAHAAIEFIYTVKERAYLQFDDTQPDTPVEWLFGAGGSGDSQLTALNLIVGSNDPVSIDGTPGEFDLETDPFASQAALDAAYPNGPYSLSVTDGGSNQNLGPFNITGDAYPVVPYFTNAAGLATHDLSQDYLLTWNSFSGANAGDQILIQIWDDTNDNDFSWNSSTRARPRSRSLEGRSRRKDSMTSTCFSSTRRTG